MQLVIDIPEDAYNRLLEEQHLPNRIDLEYFIVHGTPLEKVLEDIKAEIIEHSHPVRYDYNSIEMGMTLTGIMQAFDNHISGGGKE